MRIRALVTTTITLLSATTSITLWRATALITLWQATVLITLWRATALITLWLATAAIHAHDGPPFPIVSDREAGAYLVSIWTDPDTTDDGSAGGQFWVMMMERGSSASVPAGTRVAVTAAPHERPGPVHTADAAPVSGSASTYFAGLVLADEGRFDVRVTIQGPLGPATIDATVDATYDTRPAPLAVLFYLLPFVVMGALWTRLLLRRRNMARTAGSTTRGGRRGDEA
jgi:hypothetical protein